jgi:hypothetical protein
LAFVFAFLVVIPEEPALNLKIFGRNPFIMKDLRGILAVSY